MPKRPEKTGDFGFRKKLIRRNQIVAFYDLVGYTDLDSNYELYSAVRAMETGLEAVLSEDYFWADKDSKGVELPENNVLLLSTGDGYVVAFSEAIKDKDALRCLIDIYNKIRKKHDLRLGISIGENYVFGDLTDRVNIVGWGINVAARALQFAEVNQIICTSRFAEQLVKSHGDEIDKGSMIDIGTHPVKNMQLHLYNYYKKDEFGAPTTTAQRREGEGTKARPKTSKKKK